MQPNGQGHDCLSPGQKPTPETRSQCLPWHLPPTPLPPHQVEVLKKILAPLGTQIFQNSQHPLSRASTQAPTLPDGQLLCTIRPSHTGPFPAQSCSSVWGCGRMGRLSVLQVAGRVLPMHSRWVRPDPLSQATLSSHFRLSTPSSSSK